MHLLVIGSGGLVGSNVVRSAQRRGWSVTGTFHSERPAFEVALSRLDVRQREKIRTVVRRIDPDAVVNCAAMTDVNACESDSERAYAVNAMAPGALAEVCQEFSLPFVHLSTDYVFDGETRTSYDESATPDPMQTYGRSKRAGERAVMQSHDAPLILRLSFVYGVHRGGEVGRLAGFPAWVCNRLQAGESTPLFTDQRVSPSRAGQVADCLPDLIHEQRTGVLHVASRSCVTPYEFGTMIRKRLDAPQTLLEPASIADVERPAPRPRHTCLDVEAVETCLGGKQPTLEEDLGTIDARFLGHGDA